MSEPQQWSLREFISLIRTVLHIFKITAFRSGPKESTVCESTRIHAPLPPRLPTLELEILETQPDLHAESTSSMWTQPLMQCRPTKRQARRPEVRKAPAHLSLCVSLGSWSNHEIPFPDESRHRSKRLVPSAGRWRICTTVLEIKGGRGQFPVSHQNPYLNNITHVFNASRSSLTTEKHWGVHNSLLNLN